VVWWTSAFDHFTKRQRVLETNSVQTEDGYELVLLKALGYQRNVSVRRVLDHRLVARRFRKEAGRSSRPDVILCSLPTVGLAAEATTYGAQRGVPVIVDIRDLWPDVIEEIAPAALRPFARVALAPMYGSLRRVCRKAAAIVGPTDAFVDWALAAGGRPRTSLDRVFPMAYLAQDPSESEITQAARFWDERGILANGGVFVVCFFGTMGRQFDLDTVIETARLLASGTRSIRFVLCGSGERLDYYRTRAAECTNVLFPGWVGSPEIWTLMRRAHIGIAPYRDSPNFVGNLPNKPVEYLSAGLPVLTGIQGVLQQLIEKEECGWVYRNGATTELAELIRRVAENQQLLEKASINARRVYESQFMAERVYDEMAEYLETLACCRSTRSCVDGS
jgi:glycosyltransferase involved in cell wall biosynthesis